MKKRLLSMLLSLVLILVLLPADTFAVNGMLDYETDIWYPTSDECVWTSAEGYDYYFYVYHEGSETGPLYASLRGIDFHSDGQTPIDLTLPETLTFIPEGGTEGTEIPLRAVYSFIRSDTGGGDVLRSITIPACVETIEQTFYECTVLESVVFESGSKMKSLCYRQFYNCPALRTVVLPDSLLTIDRQAFNDVDSLDSISLPDSVESVGDQAFCDCDGLKSVRLGKNLNSLGENVFTGCGSLESLDMSSCNSLKEIPAETFSSCRLSSISIPDCVQTIGSEAFSNQSYYVEDEQYNSTLCYSLTSLDLGSGVSHICEYAFDRNRELKGTLTLPDSLTTIDEAAFSECGITNISWPDNTGFTAVSGFGYCTSLSAEAVSSLPDTVTVIGTGAFAGCTGFTSLTIPAHISVIEERAFSGCLNLSTLNILPGVQTIGAEAFGNCSGLTENTVELPDSVKYICSGAFAVYDRWTENEDRKTLTIKIPNPDLELVESDETYINGNLYSWYAPEDTSMQTPIYGADAFAWLINVDLYGPATNSSGQPSALKTYAETHNGTWVSAFSNFARNINFHELDDYQTEHKVSGTVPDGATVTVKRGGVEVPVTVSGSSFSASVLSGADVAVIAKKTGYYDQVVVRSASDFTEDWTVEFGSFEALPSDGKFTVELTCDGSAYTGFDGLAFTLKQGSRTLTENTDYTVSYPYIILTDPSKYSATAAFTLTVAPDASLKLAEASAQASLNDGSFSVELISLGKAKITVTGTPRCKVMLFDSTGSAVGMGGTTAGTFFSDPLPAGTYTAAAFEENGYFSSVGSLSGFGELGLTKGSDYASGTVSIQNGKTAELSLSVPSLDTSSFSSMLDENGCAVIIREPRAIKGQDLQIHVYYALKDKSVNNAQISFILPENASVRSVCNETRQLSVSGNSVTVDKASGTLYLTVRCSDVGKQSFSAAIKTGDILLPLGSASVEVQELFIETADPYTQQLTENRADIYAAPQTEVSLDTGSGDPVTARTNYIGHASVSYSLPEDASYGQQFTLTASAGDASAKTSVSYFPMDSMVFTTVEDLSFIHGGYETTLINRSNPEAEDSIYTYYVTGKEKDKYFTFTTKINTEEDLEDVAVIVTMQDGSTRSVPLSLQKREGDLNTYVGVLYVDNDGDHVFHSRYIPEGFEVTWSVEEIEPDLSSMYLYAEKAVEEQAAERSAAIEKVKEETGIDSVEVSEESLTEILNEFENSLGDYKDTSKVEATIASMKEVTDVPYFPSPFGYAYRVTDRSGIGKLIMSSADRDEEIAMFRAHTDMTDAEKEEAIAEVNALYEQGQEALADAYFVEESMDQMCELLTEYLGLSKPLQEFSDWDEVFNDMGVTVTTPPAHTQSELEAAGYTDTGSGLLFSETDGSHFYGALIPGSAGTAEAAGSALSAESLSVSGNDSSSAAAPLPAGTTDMLEDLKEGYEAAVEVASDSAEGWARTALADRAGQIANAVEAHGDSIIKYTEERTASVLKHVRGNQNFYFRRAILDDLRAERAWGETVKSCKGGIVFLGRALGVYNLIKDRDAACENIVKTAEDEAAASELDVLIDYYKTHLDIDHTSCLGSLQAEKAVYDALIKLMKNKSTNLYVNIGVGAGSLAADIFSGGTFKTVSATATTGYVATSAAVMANRDYAIARLRQQIRKLHAKRVEDCGGDGFHPIKHVIVLLDPSGTVYEAVESNVLSGVTATICDASSGSAWNAEDYGQINPQITGDDGSYAWDVPSGTWKVTFSKDGYENASTDELTVPPPRMNLKTGMISKADPEVESINAYTDYIEVIFSQYMDTSVKVTASGYTCEWVNKEAAGDGSSKEYSKVLHLIPASKPAVGDKVSAVIKGAKNYAGKALGTYSSPELTVARRPAELILNYEGSITALINESKAPRVTARVLDSEGSPIQGLKVNASGWSELFADVTAVNDITDESGTATFEIGCLLPGMTEITFALEGSALCTVIPLRISVDTGQVARPSAAIGDYSFSAGSPKENYATVASGSKLTLSCEDEDAVIYYTLDDTCPCQNTAGRIEYTGPVTVTKDSYFRIAAYKEGMEYSERLNIKVTVNAPVKNPFKDVTEDDFFYDPVLWAINHDPVITTGTSPDLFSPNNTCLREQFVTFLWRAAGEPEPKSTVNPFSDVSKDKYYYKAVLWALEKNITTGTTATTFSPTAPCLRGQVVTFLYRYNEEPPTAGLTCSFTDVTDDMFYYKPVLWAADKGVTTGTTATTFSPNSPCLRGQTVTFLYRDMN